MNLNFLLGAKTTYRSLVRRDSKKKGKKNITFLVDMIVPEYDESRKVRIIFREGAYDFPKIYTDGANESKHRYKDNSLCIWNPDDVDKNKWKYKDGLLQLLALIQLHLFREAYWRDTGEWVGPEAEH